MTPLKLTAFILAAAGAITVVATVAVPDTAEAAGEPRFAADGKLLLPKGYRKWIFLGSPLTPNALNNGKAGFPEYHNVYIQEKNLAGYRKEGVFPEGTIIVKELVLLRNSTFPDGSGNTPAGRGYSQGAFNGLDVMVKDKKRFAETNGWGFFNFGHHAEPYLPATTAAAAADCAGCHRAGAAKSDMTWVEFYPILRAAD